MYHIGVRFQHLCHNLRTISPFSQVFQESLAVAVRSELVKGEDVSANAYFKVILRGFGLENLLMMGRTVYILVERAHQDPQI